MGKQELYKFIGRLVVFIHGLYVLLCSKDIINLVIGVIGSLLIFLLIPKIVTFLFNNSFFDVKDDAYRFEHRGRKIIAVFFSISILGSGLSISLLSICLSSFLIIILSLGISLSLSNKPSLLWVSKSSSISIIKCVSTIGKYY